MKTVRIMDAKLRTEVTATYEAGCRAKDPTACFILGMYLDDDGGLPIDGKRAFELFTAACKAGFAPACLRESIFYRVSVPSSEPDTHDAAKRGDERCVACEMAICRKENCCPTCENRRTNSCCAGEFGEPLRFPPVTPTPDPQQVAHVRKDVRTALAPEIKRLKALCGDGFAPACRDLAHLFYVERFRPLSDPG